MENQGTKPNGSTSSPQVQPQGGFRGHGGQGGFHGGGQGGRRPGGFRTERPKPEFDQKLIDVRRVARVVAGGRRFSFAVALVAGDRKGKVGVGTGKAGDTAGAIDKAMRSAKKAMIKVKTTPTMSIAHQVEAKYSSARLMIKPAPGRGLVAGSAVRNVLDLGGVKDVNAKILSPSKNKLNIARAAIAALKSL
jgi:small subunit ribosomal protein S5